MKPKLKTIVFVVLNFLVALVLVGNVWLWSEYLSIIESPHHDMLAGMLPTIGVFFGTPVLLLCGLILLKAGRTPRIRLLNAWLPLVTAAILGLMYIAPHISRNEYEEMVRSNTHLAIRLEQLLLVLVIVTAVASLILLHRQARPKQQT